MPAARTRCATSAGPATRADARTTAGVRQEAPPRGTRSHLDICENLYAAGTTAAPYWAYEHDVPSPPARTATRAATRSPGSRSTRPRAGRSPPRTAAALFFADYSRDCIWVMQKGANGLPDRDNVEMFANLGIYPVDLKVDPRGDLFYVDITSGRSAASPTPARTTGRRRRTPRPRPTMEQAPLEVGFDATGSTDPDAATRSPTSGTSTATASSSPPRSSRA